MSPATAGYSISSSSNDESLLGCKFDRPIFLTHLIGGEATQSYREFAENDYYEIFRGHKRTNGTPRRWGVAVVAV